MNHLATLFIASLFFHTSSTSSQGTKPDNALKITKERFLENLNLVMSLSQAFRTEQTEVRHVDTLHLLNTLTVPFAFPIFDSYDMDLATKLSKGTRMTPQRIFSILVQIIYTLLLFHIERLFKLDPSEPFVPNRNDDNGDKEEINPQYWFDMLLGAIMPGAIVNGYGSKEPIEVSQIHVKPFQFLKKSDKLFDLCTHKDGIPETLTQHSNEESPTVPVSLLPDHFLGKKLAPGQAVLHSICLERSYPSCKKILDHLLKGITFAFDLDHAEIKVIVKPTEDIPSVEESRNVLIKLFEVPIRTQIMIPEDIEDVLQRRTIPKASCYHPDKVAFSSPELYERMLTVIIAGGIPNLLYDMPNSRVGAIASSLKEWIRLFLPDSSVEAFKMEKCAPGTKVCTYNPVTSSMWIYKGDIGGKKIGILLKLGKPLILNHSQMGMLKRAVFPFSCTIPVVQIVDTPVKQIARAIVKRLEEPMKVVNVEKHTLPAISGSGNENKATALKQFDKSTFKSDGFQGTTSEDTFSPEKRISQISFTYSADKLSRNYARNTASHFESPKVQTKIYQQSRRVSLEVFFGGKILVVFNADKLPVTKDALSKEKPFYLFESEGTKTKHSYYVSCHKEYFIAGEGVELVYFIPTPNASKPNLIKLVECLVNPIFKDYSKILK